ncbi:MAG: methyltransferase domain-containing protein [Alphaproteobacteria bacterium]
MRNITGQPRRRDDCRLCGGGDLDLVLRLTPTPPANAFLPAVDAGTTQACFPLEVYLCRACGHVQLRDILDPEALFRDYIYVSGTSPAFVKHFDDYAADLITRYRLPTMAPILDIGSNDGTLLRAFQDRRYNVLGIEPASAIAEAARNSGVDTIIGFFNQELAEKLLEQRGPVVLVTANNVFAHIDNLSDMLRGVRTLLTPGGLFVFEVSYLADVIEKGLFDTIYHEHLSYHAVRPLIPFLEAHGLELIEALRVDSHGGSLRGVAKVRGAHWTPGASVEARLAEEARLGLHEPATYRAFGERIAARGEALRALLRELKAKGKTIAGYGAPAKATTLLYHFGIGPQTLDFIVDDSPWKQGRLTPGHQIPVLPSTALLERRPDYTLILAWNFAQPIVARQERYRAEGGQFIIPLPELMVV